MPQFGRPNSDISVVDCTGSPDNTNKWANIDETVASNTDFVWTTVNTDVTFEVGVNSVSDPNIHTGHTIRYRVSKRNGATLDGGGNAVTATVSLVEGTTVISTDVARTLTGTPTDYSWTISTTEAGNITNYGNLRLRFVISKSGGSPAARRGGGIEWGELEVPDVVAIIRRVIVIS